MRVLLLPMLILAAGAHAQTKGKVVAWPWTFTKGTETAQQTAIDTAAIIGEKRGYAVLDRQQAFETYNDLKSGWAWRNGVPTRANLQQYGKAVGADLVLYGHVKWHTRSIWVGTGPKTISTATADVYVFDVKKNRTVYSRKGVEGRSDEKENTLKVVGAVLLTPLVTAVSGGPATPREQRAAQIALGRAYSRWALGK